MQLEEFERAVRSSYGKNSSDDARGRHHEFIIAIEDQISKIENSLRVSDLSEGKASLHWVRLDEGECNELALFLSGPSKFVGKTTVKSTQKDIENPRMTDKGSAHDCSKNLQDSAELGSVEAREDKSHGHRRTASASADIGSCKIVVPDDGCQQNSSNGQTVLPFRKIPSLSGFLSSMEYASKLKWSKNGFRKWKAMDRQHEADTAFLQSPQLSRVCVQCFKLFLSFRLVQIILVDFYTYSFVFIIIFQFSLPKKGHQCVL